MAAPFAVKTAASQQLKIAPLTVVPHSMVAEFTATTVAQH
jgi:hypothetical protein